MKWRIKFLEVQEQEKEITIIASNGHLPHFCPIPPRCFIALRKAFALRGMKHSLLCVFLGVYSIIIDRLLISLDSMAHKFVEFQITFGFIFGEMHWWIYVLEI